MRPYFSNQHTFLQTPIEQKQQTFNQTDRQSAKSEETNYLWIKTKQYLI